MTLRDAIERYVLWRRAHGAKFTTGASLLSRFLHHSDGGAASDAVTTAQVLAVQSQHVMAWLTNEQLRLFNADGFERLEWRFKPERFELLGVVVGEQPVPDVAPLRLTPSR